MASVASDRDCRYSWMWRVAGTFEHGQNAVPASAVATGAPERAGGMMTTRMCRAAAAAGGGGGFHGTTASC